MRLFTVSREVKRNLLAPQYHMIRNILDIFVTVLGRGLMFGKIDLRASDSLTSYPFAGMEYEEHAPA